MFGRVPREHSDHDAARRDGGGNARESRPHSETRELAAAPVLLDGEHDLGRREESATKLEIPSVEISPAQHDHAALAQIALDVREPRTSACVSSFNSSLVVGRR